MQKSTLASAPAVPWRWDGSQFGSSVNSFAISVCMCCGYTLARVLWASWKDYPTSDWTFWGFVFVCSRLHWRPGIRFPKRLCHPRSQQQLRTTEITASCPDQLPVLSEGLVITFPVQDCTPLWWGSVPPLSGLPCLLLCKIISHYGAYLRLNPPASASCVVGSQCVLNSCLSNDSLRYISS